MVQPNAGRVYDRNPHNYNFGKQGAYLEGGDIHIRAHLNNRPGKNYFEKFTDWINAPGNGQNVFKAVKLHIDLLQEIFSRAADSASLSRMSSFLGKLREGHAPLYWLKCTKDLFSPSNPQSLTGRVQAAFDWTTATLLNIHIFAPVFDRATTWTAPGMTCTTLVSDSIELCDNVGKLSRDQTSPAFFKVLSCVCAVAVGVFGVLALVLDAPLIPAVVLLTISVGAINFKLIGSFWEYVREPVII